MKLLLSALSDSYGLRIRSGGPSCRLRQPGAIPPCLPGAATLLSHSPLNFPTLHIDLSRSMVTLSPHGVNFGFLKMLPQFGRAVQRNLSPRCRNTASKRQAAAEALQNVCALRSGARDLLSVGVPSALRFSPCKLLCSCALIFTIDNKMPVLVSTFRVEHVPTATRVEPIPM